MKAREKSPVKLVCKRVSIGPKVFKNCRWTCRTRGFTTVMFRHRRNKNAYSILHPSTRKPGWWQVTDFDELGPVRHVERRTCADALHAASITQIYTIDKTENAFVRKRR